MVGRPRTEAELYRELTGRVRVDGDCHVWAGYYSTTGYPCITHQRRNHSARRLLMTLLHGKDLGRRFVYDTCDNRGCMNPAHLRLGTEADIKRVAAKRGRYMTGPARALASRRQRGTRLPLEDRRLIIARRARGELLRDIAADYGVGITTLSKALIRWDKTFGPAL